MGFKSQYFALIRLKQKDIGQDSDYGTESSVKKKVRRSRQKCNNGEKKGDSVNCVKLFFTIYKDRCSVPLGAQ